MKSFLPAAILSLTLVSCASKKADTTATAPAPAQTSAVETAKTDVKKAKNKTVKAVKEKAAEAKTAVANATSGGADTTCKSGSDERKLAIAAKDSGCELQYTKAGQTSTIASQINGNTKCETVMGTVKEKLIASGFSCQ